MPKVGKEFNKVNFNSTFEVIGKLPKFWRKELLAGPVPNACILAT